jgi:amino acid permease
MDKYNKVSKSDSSSQRLSDKSDTDSNYEGMGVREGALALMSACVGGGILGVPFAFYFCGLPLGILINLFLIICCYRTIRLLSYCNFMIPGKPESYYEIGYMVLGRKMIFFLSFIIWFNCVGLLMIYYIVLGEISSSLVKQWVLAEGYEGIFATRDFYIGLIYILNIPLVIVREVKEFKIISFIMFFGLFSFLAIMFFQLMFHGMFMNKD